MKEKRPIYLGESRLGYKNLSREARKIQQTTFKKGKENQCLLTLPAAGYRNNSNGTLNNVGTNGNYWSSTQNDTSNAYNLNFNDSNADWNNNNRTNGFSVRPVAELSTNRFYGGVSKVGHPHFFTLLKDYDNTRKDNIQQ